MHFLVAQNSDKINLSATNQNAIKMPQSLNNPFAHIQQLLLSQYIADYQQGLQKLSKKNNQQIQTTHHLIKKNHQKSDEALAQLAQRNQHQLQTLQQQLAEQIQGIHQQHQKTINHLQQQFEKETQNIKQQHQKTVNHLQQQIQQLKQTSVTRQDLAQMFADMTHNLQKK